ncbi:Fanes1-like protein, partial [Thalictrum thalictroides]
MASYANFFSGAPSLYVSSHAKEQGQRDMSTPKSINFTYQSSTPNLSLVCRPSQDYRALHDRKLKKVREVLGTTIAESPLESFVMIDTLQCFSIDYHFQEEIQAFLSRQHKCVMDSGGSISFDGDCNLFTVSLCFRLFRQNGYNVPTDMFNRFVDKHGKFRQSLSNDLKGMMALYQASYLGIEGEDILDQARVFTTKSIHDSLPHLNQDQASVISFLINHPYHTSLSRFLFKESIKNLKTKQGTYNVLLQELGEVDFNIVQILHRSELQKVFLWWNDMGLAQSLKFARDQPLKWYMWLMVTLADPKYSNERVELVKPVCFVYLMDDIFDVCGTLDELVLFTESINKWEVNATKQLPYSMKIFLQALYDFTDEFSSKILEKYGWNPMNSLKTAWMQLCNAFLVEAKWFASGHLPASEEYLHNGVITTGLHVVFVHMFFLLGEGINKESIDLIDNNRSLITYPSLILRLWDDLGTAKDEDQQGHDGSYIECYMNEHKNSTMESVREH